MKPVSKMTDEELCEVYTMCCEDIEPALKKLKTVVENKQFSVEEVNYIFVKNKARYLNTLHEEFQKRFMCNGEVQNDK